MKGTHSKPTGIRQIITSPNGGKATLIITGKIAQIEQYKPSKKYHNHVLGKVTTIHISQMDKHREKLNLNRKRTHLQLISKYLGPLFDYITNPAAKDEWMNSSPAKQFAKYVIKVRPNEKA